jgi:transcriptional regulator with XRE-family HTH domain
MPKTNYKLATLASVANVKPANLFAYLSHKRERSPSVPVAKTLAEVTDSNVLLWLKGGDVTKRQEAVDAWYLTTNPGNVERPESISSNRPLKGRRLKEIRIQQGVSTSSLCDKVGIKRSTLYVLENGGAQGSIQLWEKLATALDTPIEVLRQKLNPEPEPAAEPEFELLDEPSAQLVFNLDGHVCKDGVCSFNQAQV